MLHELLLALLGYTGDLIIDEREHQNSLRIQLSADAPVSDGRTFKLAPDISFIEPSERYIHRKYQFHVLNIIKINVIIFLFTFLRVLLAT